MRDQNDMPHRVTIEVVGVTASDLFKALVVFAGRFLSQPITIESGVFSASDGRSGFTVTCERGEPFSPQPGAPEHRAN